jgi:hypothetical protein
MSFCQDDEKDELTSKRPQDLRASVGVEGLNLCCTAPLARDGGRTSPIFQGNKPPLSP